MALIIYTIYALLIVIFLAIGGLAVYHALRHVYLSPRVRPVTIVFVALSLVLIAVSTFFLTRIDI